MKYKPISVTLLGLFLFVLLALASVLGRWGTLNKLYLMLPAICVWVVLLLMILRFIPNKPNNKNKRRQIFVISVVSVVLFCVLLLICSQLGKLVVKIEIQNSISMGLRNDSLQLIAAWPGKADRVYFTDKEFLSFPASIRALKPVYVSNDKLTSTNLPASVSLCKNGFGGFAAGIRIFENDADAQMAIKITGDRAERIVEGVYLWWQGT